MVADNFESMTRSIINLALLLVTTYFIFTIDKDGKETTYNQVRSFTSLIILINIDNILAPTAGVIYAKLKLFEHKSVFVKEDQGGKKDEKPKEKETVQNTTGGEGDGG